jgi:hypothetical protein
MSVQTAAQAANSALKKGCYAWTVLTTVSVICGYARYEIPGVWGGLLGGLLAGSFFAVTAIVAAKTANMDVQYLGFAVLGSWLLKIILLVCALFWLRSQDFYSRPAFFVTLLIETIALLILEAVLVTRAPVPYVTPKSDARG